MAPRLILRKTLSQTDVKHRLALPAKILHLLPPFEERANCLDVPVRVRYGNELEFHMLRCTIRRRGPKKPVLTRGWMQLVRDKGLRQGDLLVLHVNDDDGEFVLEFHRNIRLFGRDILDATIP